MSNDSFVSQPHKEMLILARGKQIQHSSLSLIRYCSLYTRSSSNPTNLYFVKYRNFIEFPGVRLLWKVSA